MSPEVLAPAGNREMLIAAVRSGADAVYLGAEEFSARRNAENFSREALREAVDYCHIRGVKVYLALNILIKDSEMQSALSLAQYAYTIGINGVIIQDLGLAQLLHKHLPGLSLHASTQMSIHSPSALEQLKKFGFCQVVAAREMSSSQLRELCIKAKEFNITVEAFVHGALCMCVSGQCLFSAFLGSRSGNRGLCAGPCRLPFGANGRTGYDLSLKDLSLLDYISELKEMGVGSFKIEGRMKRPEYVAAAVTACRQAVDYGKPQQDIKQILRDVFSRSGFTDGYFTDNIGNEMFGIRTKEDVTAAEKAFPVLHQLYRNERQSIGVNMEFTALKNQSISLSLNKGEVTVFSEPAAPAKSKEATCDEIKASLSKLGGTPYYLENIKINLDKGLFIPQAIINALRREACERLSAIRCKYKKEDVPKISLKKDANNDNFGSDDLVVRFERANQIPENIDILGVKAVALAIEENPALMPETQLFKIADIPSAVSSEELLLKRLMLFYNNGFKAAFCNNLAQITLCKQVGLIPLGGAGLNIFNSYSARTAAELGVKGIVLSNEITEKGAANIISPIKKGITIYGNIPLMVFKNCPVKRLTNCSECKGNGTLTDRMGVSFPVRCRLGYSELLNSCPIWLADKWQGSKSDFGVLYFTLEDKERVREVIAAFNNKSAPNCKHTKGLYFRGVI